MLAERLTSKQCAYFRDKSTYFRCLSGPVSARGWTQSDASVASPDSGQPERSTHPRVVRMCVHEMMGDKMFKLIVSSITGATLIAGTVAFAATSAPAADVLMVTVRDANQTQTVTKGDRLRVAVKGSGCSVHGWPNFEPKCQFDLRQPGGEARNVRVIALH
jgi:hypothetical protein